MTALEIIAFLNANSGGLQAVDMISLQTNMHAYYVHKDSISQYINMLEDAQKKTKWAGMPIADVKLIMMASAAVLAAQHFPHKVDDWEGLPSTTCTWMAWKQSFRLAHLKHQHQILALGGGEPLRWAHGVLPVGVPATGWLGCALDNLALAAMNNYVMLQQLTVANLALTTTVTAFTATNKTMMDSAVQARAAANATGMLGGRCLTGKHWPGSYCWMHSHLVSKKHTSATCRNKAVGHCDDAMTVNTMGGSNKDKGWKCT